MNIRRITGFTLVELMMVMSIMLILMAISLGSFFYLDGQARDSERENDANAIAQALERIYVNKKVGDGSTPTYPATSDAATVFVASYFRGLSVDPEILYSPGNNANATNTAIPDNVVMATNSTQTPAGVTPAPQPDTYVYQPIARNGGLCTTFAATNPCIKFNLYYKKESPSYPTPYKITSLNQQ